MSTHPPSTPTPHQRAALAWQKRKNALKLCRYCGRNPVHRTYRAVSKECLKCIRRRQQRQREGRFQPWKPGGTGRPPKWI